MMCVCVFEVKCGRRSVGRPSVARRIVTNVENYSSADAALGDSTIRDARPSREVDASAIDDGMDSREFCARFRVARDASDARDARDARARDAEMGTTESRSIIRERRGTARLRDLRLSYETVLDGG